MTPTSLSYALSRVTAGAVRKEVNMPYVGASVLEKPEYTLAVHIALQENHTFTLPNAEPGRSFLKGLLEELLSEAVVQRVDDKPETYALTGKAIACKGSAGEAG